MACEAKEIPLNNDDFTDGLNVCNPERLNNGCMIYRVSEKALAEFKLARAYADAVAENPDYPHESADEKKAARKRRKVGDEDGSAT
jgi:hypothetical protein